MRKPGPGLYLRGVIWWIAYTGPRPDGSWGLIRESSGSVDPDAAAKLRDDRIREAKNDRDGIRKFVGPRQRQVTVGQLLDKLESHYETARLKSLRQMKVHLAHVRTFFGFKRATGVSRAAIDTYIARRREEEAAEATIDRELELLRRAYSLEKEEERPLIAWVPKVPRLVCGDENAKEGFVERSQLEKLLPELPSQVLRDIALWAYGTGMRLGGIRSLTWNAYDQQTRTIRLPHSSSKTKRIVTLPLDGSPELAELIKRRLSERRLGSDLIFHNGRGERVGDFYTTWTRALERAKLPHFTIHDFRRTAVRNMVLAGVPERLAMDISGHKTRAIFDRYSIVREQDLAEALAKRATYEASLKSDAKSGPR
jgi:integrase